MKRKELSKKVLVVFEKHPEVKLVYLFGSQVKAKSGPLSDYDFAVYLEERKKKRMFEIKLELISEIAQVLGSDKIDLVVLNAVEAPELKYNIIKEGKLIFEREPYKVMVEPRILNEYFDFHLLLLRNNLTWAKI
ncbi:MAG TPA: nucleotidyltransferase domain-containing protein [Candidatus Aminicenantes bacterium]|nr:MAG: nucleotidyltransferase [Candidatus Aminicenantes bacterium]HEK85615.1 nucleotidyltransferase domain-containing protein [Candidatus Aminicenantes bacterium]